MGIPVRLPTIRTEEPRDIAAPLMVTPGSPGRRVVPAAMIAFGSTAMV